jgi:hypothetical protein
MLEWTKVPTADRQKWKELVDNLRSYYYNNIISRETKFCTVVTSIFGYSISMAYPGILFGGGFNKFSWGQRAERTGIWERYPLVRVSAHFANEWNPYSYWDVTDVFSTELGIRLSFVKTSVRHCSIWNLLHTSLPPGSYSFEVAPILCWNICAPLSSCMEPIPSREANSCSATQDFPCLLWHLKVWSPCTKRSAAGTYHQTQETHSTFSKHISSNIHCLHYP